MTNIKWIGYLFYIFFSPDKIPDNFANGCSDMCFSVRLQRMGSDVQNMTISTDQREEFGINVSRRKRSIDKLRDSYLIPQPRAKRQVTG